MEAGALGGALGGALDDVEAALARGDVAAAVIGLVPVLEGRGDDRVCALAARVLAHVSVAEPFAPDAMAAVVDRLVALLREQEAQIAALRAMLGTAL